MTYSIGELVKSIAGHDAGKLYVILDIKKDSLVLANGREKTVAKPKVKKMKHVQLIHEQLPEVCVKIKENRVIDADLIYAIRVYKGE